MTVIYLLNGFPRPSETFITDELCGLVQLGCDVRVIALQRGNGNISEHQRSLLDGRITYAAESQTFLEVVRAATYLGPRLLLRPSLWGVAYSLLVGAPGLLYRSALLTRYLSRHSVSGTVLVSHFASIGIVTAFARGMGFLRGMPHVNVSHGSDLSALPRRIGSSPYHLLFRQQGTHVVTIAERWVPHLKALGAESVHLRRLGIDLSLFEFAPRNPPRGRPVRILTVGRLVEKKGYMVTLKALATLSSRVEFEYHIIGGGPLEGVIRETIDEYGLAGKVILHGVMSADAVRVHMTQADIFVLASHEAENGDCEGLPVSLMEAMASGLPVVTTYHSGIPELVDHDRTGFLAREKDVDDLSSQIEKLASHLTDWSSVAHQARNKVEREYDNKKNIRKFLEFLGSVESSSQLS